MESNITCFSLLGLLSHNFKFPCNNSFNSHLPTSGLISHFGKGREKEHHKTAQHGASSQGSLMSGGEPGQGQSLV